jgi:hypothetical protein
MSNLSVIDFRKKKEHSAAYIVARLDFHLKRLDGEDRHYRLAVNCVCKELNISNRRLIEARSAEAIKELLR